MKSKKNNSIPNGLAAVRMRLGFSQLQLALKLDVSRSTIEHVENNRRSLPTQALIKLALLEIEQQDKQSEVNMKEPVDIKVHDTRSKASRFSNIMIMQETACRLKGHRLSLQLTNMIAQFERAKDFQLILEKNLHDGTALRRQKEANTKKLDRSGLVAQSLLRHEIALMEAQAALYSNMQLHIKNEIEKQG